MFTKLKNAAALMIVMGALAGCATQPQSGGMKMDSGMCKKMMEQGKCGCCKNMGDMSASGTMSGAQPMQCMPQTTDEPAHKAHHPVNAR